MNYRKFFGLNMTKPQLIYTVVFLSIIITLSINHSKNKKEKYDEISTYQGITTGTVTRYERNGSSGRSVYYSYEVEGSNYEALANGNKWFEDCLETKSCIGLKYQVYYSTKNPRKSRIDWNRPID